MISDGSLLGIVSEVDYARRVVLQGRSSKKTPVKDIMTSNPVTVAPEDTVDDCMRIMTHHHIRHLPVFEGSELVGILSIEDLVSSVIADQSDTIDELHQTWG